MDQKNNNSKDNNSTPTSSMANIVTQEQILPGAVKPRHLVVTPQDLGVTYYSDGTNMAALSVGATGSLYRVSGSLPSWLAPGTSGQILTISGGVPVWAANTALSPTVVQFSTVTSSFTTTSGTYVDNTVSGASVTVTTTVTCNIFITTSITWQNDTATASLFLGIGKGTNTALWEKSVDAAHTSVGTTTTLAYTDVSVAAGTNTYHLGGHTNGGNTLNITAATITAIAIPA